MKKQILSLIIASFSLGIYSSYGQNNHHMPSVTYNEEGRFMQHYRNMKLSYPDLAAGLNNIFRLDEDHTFIQSESKVSKLTGIHHYKFSQYYKGFKVQNSEILVRADKQGHITSVSGRIMPQPDKQIDLKVNIDEAAVREIIRKQYNIISVYHATPAELVILHNNNHDARLVYKMRVDGLSTQNKKSFNEYYISAQTGEIIKISPKISHIGVEGVAHTYYNGEQTITSDLEDGVYYLRDNERKITTYNAGVSLPALTPGATSLYPDALLYTNNSENWTQQNTLNTIRLEIAEDASLLDGIGLDFSTYRGNRLLTSVEKIDGITSLEIARKEELGLFEFISLPYTINNFGAILEEGFTYKVTITKDSCMIDFSTFELVSVMSFEDSKVEFIIEASDPGTHTWSDGDNSGRITIDYMANPALDAHWGIAKSHDYYKDKFERVSFDGEATPVTNYYNGTALLAGTQNNAAALNEPYNAMVFGTGEDGYKPFVVLDVTGHEYSHLVIGTSSNLEYTGESGALNEAFADMMGIAIENYALGGLDEWYMGDGLHDEVPFIRNLSNPNEPGMEGRQQPDTYKGLYWAPTGSTDPDEGGVHTNSGVGNYWFYLLSEGGEGVNDNGYNYNVPAIGIEKAERIAFLAFTEYMVSTSQYMDAYEATKEAAIDLYGEGSAEYNAVVDAWKAVGIPKETSTDREGSFKAQVSIYPNPSDGTLYFNVMDGHQYDIAVYNVLGQEVHRENSLKGLVSLDLKNLNNGVYTIRLSNELGASSQKISIMK